jgi:hypothetical protein
MKMKKTLLFGIILTLCVVIVAFVFAQVYPEGMISYWQLDEGSGSIAIDSVNGNHGIIQGATWTTGQADGALSFDGGNDYVAIGDIGLDTTEFTISLWMNTEKGDGALVCNNMLYWGGNQGWLFWIFNYQFSFAVNHSEAVISAYYPDDMHAYKGKWIHLVFTKDTADQTKIYFDGLETSSYIQHDAWVSPNFPTGENIEIARRWDEGWYFNGAIDEVAIYSRALTACEIYQHYNNGLVGKGYTLEDSIEALIINVEDLDLPKGVRNSLTSKLDNALKSLEKGRDNAAKNKLEAFINEVEAQRGMKLTDEQADALIIAVQCIINSI